MSVTSLGRTVFELHEGGKRHAGAPVGMPSSLEPRPKPLTTVPERCATVDICVWMTNRLHVGHKRAGPARNITTNTHNLLNFAPWSVTVSSALTAEARTPISCLSDCFPMFVCRASDAAAEPRVACASLRRHQPTVPAPASSEAPPLILLSQQYPLIISSYLSC
jgi:hypothetical protein